MNQPEQDALNAPSAFPAEFDLERMRMLYIQALWKELLDQVVRHRLILTVHPVNGVHIRTEYGSFVAGYAVVGGDWEWAVRATLEKIAEKVQRGEIQ